MEVFLTDQCFTLSNIILPSPLFLNKKFTKPYEHPVFQMEVVYWF